MRTLLILSGFLVLAAVTSAAEPLTSGPQVGAELPGPFHPFHVTGENAGEKACLYCRFGGDPVAMVFARRLTPEVTALIKQLESSTEKNKAAEMGACVIFCSDDSALKSQLEELAKKEVLKNVILAIDSPAGPLEYQIAKDADVTVLLYTERVVKVNYGLRKAELTDKVTNQIVANLPKILPKK
jgi:hypothetical protein